MLDGCGPKAVQTITDVIITHIHQGVRPNFSHFSKKAYAKDLEKILQIMDIPNTSPEPFLNAVMNFYEPLFQSKYDDFNKRKSDLESLSQIIKRYQNIETFLTEMTLEPADGTQLGSETAIEDDEYVSISTIHSAKGLEWKVVFMISVVDGYIPSFQSMGSLDQLEEERRLLYVAMTRAEDKLYIIKPFLNMNQRGASNQFSGFQFSKLSRFLDQLPADQNLLEREHIRDDVESTRSQSSTFYLDDPDDDSPMFRKRYVF